MTQEISSVHKSQGRPNSLDVDDEIPVSMSNYQLPACQKPGLPFLARWIQMFQLLPPTNHDFEIKFTFLFTNGPHLSISHYLLVSFRQQHLPSPKAPTVEPGMVPQHCTEFRIRAAWKNEAKNIQKPWEYPKNAGGCIHCPFWEKIGVSLVYYYLSSSMYWLLNWGKPLSFNQSAKNIQETFQLEFQYPKMEVLYHIKPHF